MQRSRMCFTRCNYLRLTAIAGMYVKGTILLVDERVGEGSKLALELLSRGEVYCFDGGARRSSKYIYTSCYICHCRTLARELWIYVACQMYRTNKIITPIIIVNIFMIYTSVCLLILYIEVKTRILFFRTWNDYKQNRNIVFFILFCETNWLYNITCIYIRTINI